ncbi:hypothetical protein MTO96_002195 [Rhipicephalus appendiculatus]
MVVDAIDDDTAPMRSVTPGSTSYLPLTSRGERGPWAEATTGNAVASASSPPSPPPGVAWPSPSDSSSRASSSSTAVVVVVASPGPGRRPGPARRPPGGPGAVAVIGEGDLDVGRGIEDVDDVVDEGVFVEEVLVVAGDLESPLRRSLLLNDFDPEGFGEIPWSDFLRALETPEFCQAVGPAKREILTAKAHRSLTSAITFDDFVAVESFSVVFGKRRGLMADRRRRQGKGDIFTQTGSETGPGGMGG